MRALAVVLSLVSLAACGRDRPSTPTDTGGVPDAGDAASGLDTAGSDATSDPSDAQSIDADDAPDVRGEDVEPLGGDRPVKVYKPSDYDPSQKYPVVILLHGFGATGTLQNAYFRLSTLVDERQFILVIPEGTTNPSGQQFWNATGACCDFTNTGVDDSAYLDGLIADLPAHYAVDTHRIYFMGHSNGGYMSYRMACDHGDEIAAIFSLAGSSFADPSDCAFAGQVSVLQAHGTLDASVAYDGIPGAYPGAEELVARWAERDGCDATPVDDGAMDLDNTLSGDETKVKTYQNCENQTSVELWTIEGAGHIPAIDETFAERALDFLLAQSRP